MDTKRMFNLEAEKVILGAIIQKNNLLCEVIDELENDDFYDIKNKLIYRAIKELYIKNSVVDTTTLIECLTPVLQECGGISYISSLYSPVSVIKDYIKIIKEKSKIRKLNSALLNALNELQTGNNQSDDIMNSLELETLNIVNNLKDEIISDEKMMNLTLDNINENYNRGGGILGIKSGIKSLDMVLNGFQKSKLYVMAGRPGMCKSAFALNVSNNIAAEKTILYYSLEMPVEELGLRKLAMESYIDSSLIERGKMNDEEWIKIGEVSSNLSKGKTFTNCKPNIHINNIKAQAKKIKLQHGLDMIIIDYIGLMSKKGMGNTTAEQIGNNAMGLKNLAKEFEIPVIVLSQLNRECDKRADDKGGHRPMLSDLKESGGIEESADVVMLFYRDEYYDKDTEEPNCIECNIAKQRGGRTGAVKFGWKPEYQKITEYMDYKEVGSFDSKMFKE